MKTFPIIARLGGRDAAHSRLKARGFRHSRHALRMWSERGVIPGHAVVLLMEIAEGVGLTYDSSDFKPSDDSNTDSDTGRMQA